LQQRNLLAVGTDLRTHLLYCLHHRSKLRVGLVAPPLDDFGIVASTLDLLREHCNHVLLRCQLLVDRHHALLHAAQLIVLPKNLVLRLTQCRLQLGSALCRCGPSGAGRARKRQNSPRPLVSTLASGQPVDYVLENLRLGLALAELPLQLGDPHWL
jgi:hypothetical protein